MANKPTEDDKKVLDDMIHGMGEPHLVMLMSNILNIQINVRHQAKSLSFTEKLVIVKTYLAMLGSLHKILEQLFANTQIPDGNDNGPVH